MTSSIKSSYSSQRVLEPLKAKNLIVGLRRIFSNCDISPHSDHVLLNRLSQNRDGWPSNRIMLYTWRGVISLTWQVDYGLIH